MSIGKNALSIGAGRSQVPIIDLCHQYGCKVISSDKKGKINELFQIKKRHETVL